MSVYIDVVNFDVSGRCTDTVAFVSIFCLLSEIKFLEYKWFNASYHCMGNKETCESLSQKTPPMFWYLREKQSPVVFPAAILAQNIRLFIHNPLLIINGSLLLIAQHCIQLPQDLEDKTRLICKVLLKRTLFTIIMNTCTLYFRYFNPRELKNCFKKILKWAY